MAARASPGPTTTLAPSGSTQRGAFAVDGYAAATGSFVRSSISYPLQLSAEPLEVEVPYGGTNPDPAHCGGTPQAPGAARGYLCLYDRASSNVSVGGSGSNVQVSDVDGFGATTNVWGGELITRAAATGSVSVTGSWAVTAP